MTVSFRKARNLHSAEHLIRQNMSAYYAKQGILWDSELFKKNWSTFDNYEVCVGDQAVGILCLSLDAVACYIRDLHVESAWQGQGLGTRAIHHAAETAKKSGVRLLRLRVFDGNPAVRLYERVGFRKVKTEDNTHYMECTLCECSLYS